VSEYDHISFFRAILSEGFPDPVTSSTLRNAGVDEEYHDGSYIRSIPDECPYKRKLMKMIQTLHIDERQGKGAIFHGRFGYGKTAAAIIMLKAALAKGAQGYFYQALNIEQVHDKSWAYLSPEGVPIWDMACRSHVFVLDDLGNELQTAGYKAGNTQVVQALIRSRYNKRLPTYITTNLDISFLMESYPSLRSIFLDPKRYEIVEVTGKDWRYSPDEPS
jgi:DNA replication protein DnaC